MPLLTERGLVALALEAVTGTAETLVAGDVFECFDPSFTPGIEIGERNTFEASFDRRENVVGNRMSTITFRVPIKGSGTLDVPPPHGPLLQACGMLETINAAADVTYSLVTALASQQSATIVMQRDGKDFRIIGAMGNVKFIIAENEVPAMEFTFVGQYEAATDVALFSGFSFGTVNPPNPVGITPMSWNGQALCATAIEFDLGNDVQPRRCISEATGIKHAVIVNRDPGASADPEDELVATIDWLDEMVAGTAGILTVTIGATAGNIHTLAFPNSQIVGVTHGDRDGIVIANLTIKGRAASDAGDDAFSYIHT